jgi:ABC-type transport system involved in multi-copper enzyme maturation permease subunit
MGLLLITRFTLQEAVRRWLFVAVAILSVVMIGLFSILLNIAVSTIVPSNSYNTQIALLSGGIAISVLSMWLVYVLTSVLTIVLTAGMISGEIDANTFSVIVPKPLRRAEIILGKWLGYALLLGVYAALLFLSFEGIIYLKTGYWPTYALNALGMLELIVFSLLGLTTLLGTLVPTLVNGAIMLILFIFAPIVSVIQFIVQLLSPSQSATIQNISTLVNLVIPSDALWHGVSYFLLPDMSGMLLLGISPNTFNTPFTSGTPVAPMLVIWVMLYSVVLPLLGVWRFRKRDL